MARVELEVQKRTSYLGRRWEKGEIIEVSADEAEEYPMKGMINTGIVERIERESVETTPLQLEDLEDVEGVGPSYAEKIKEEYETVERLLEESPDEIAGSVHGVTSELAERILTKIT